MMKHVTGFLLAVAVAARSSEFQVGGYLENWKSYQGYDAFTHVYYAFLCLDQRPNPDTPRDIAWEGHAIYETMTAAPVIDVMTKTQPLWKNPHEWQRAKVAAVMKHVEAAGKKFIWALGGWSDLQRTVSDKQIPHLVKQIVALLHVGGDGIDFDWEHLSTSADTKLRAQQRSVLGKVIAATRAALNAAGLKHKTISYTTRWNCFWTSKQAASHGALTFASDGECLDTLKHASASDISWVNLMMYDAGPGTAFKKKSFFDLPTYKKVLELGAKHVGASKIVMGFEPGHQAVDGIWEGFDIDFEVVKYMRKNRFAGVMFWAINEAAKHQNPHTPKSSKHSWQGSTGANAQYIAKHIASAVVDDVIV